MDIQKKELSPSERKEIIQRMINSREELFFMMMIAAGFLSIQIQLLLIVAGLIADYLIPGYMLKLKSKSK